MEKSTTEATTEKSKYPLDIIVACVDCETTNKKSIALKSSDVNSMDSVIGDLKSNRGKEEWSISVNRVFNGAGNCYGMELSKNRTEVYENGALIEVMDMPIDTQIERMEISKSCAKAELAGLERGQQVRKYKCISRRYHCFIDLLKEESLRKAYAYLDGPWRAANGARFFRPPPVAEYNSWMEVLREEGLKFDKLVDELEAEGGILYEDVAPCKDVPYKNDRAQVEKKNSVTPEQNSSASDDGAIVKEEDIDEPDFVDRVTVIGNSTTVRMENSVTETGHTGRGAVVKMELIVEDDNAQKGGVNEASTASTRTTSDQQDKKDDIIQKGSSGTETNESGEEDEGMSEEIADEPLAKTTDTAVENNVKENPDDDSGTDGNQTLAEDTAGSQHKVRARDIIISTIGALLLCMLFVVLGYLIGGLVVFLEKNGDISGFFKAV